MASRIYYPQARANLAMLPFEVDGAGALLRTPGRQASVDALIRLAEVQPLRFTVNANDPKTADTFDVEFDQRVLPVDARLIRSVSVDLLIGDTGGLDRPFSDLSAPERLILGISDEVSTEFNTNGASVKFKGRDYAGLLLDEKWGSRRRIALGRPLDVIVADLLASSESASGLAVESLLEAMPTVGAGGRARRLLTAPADSSLLDVLWTLCVQVAVVPVVRADALQLQPPRTVRDSAAPAPFFLFGQNVESVSITKKFGFQDVPGVRVEALDTKTYRVVRGEYPKGGKVATKIVRSKTVKDIALSAPGKKTQKKDVVLWKRYVLNIAEPTQELLDRIAEQVWQRLAQQQIRVALRTRDLTAPLHDARTEQVLAQTVALPGLRNGSWLRLRKEPGALAVLDRAISAEQKRRELSARGYSDQMAALLARGWRALDAPLYVDSAQHSWDAKSGYTLDIDAGAYLTVEL